jgi:DNA-binding HxlR family transcriptional regulator
MRSYDQFCALAKALDVVGDRWTLLIVRELLTRGPCRYTDLRHGLPGVATNLLVERVREMESAGLIRRDEARFQLTDRGRALEPIVLQLGRWGAPLLAHPSRSDEFRTHWLVLPLEELLTDRAPSRPPARVELRTGDEPLVVETAGDGTVRARPGAAEKPDLVIAGEAPVILSLLTGKISVGKARRNGVHVRGDVAVLRRITAFEVPASPRQPPGRRRSTYRRRIGR